MKQLLIITGANGQVGSYLAQAWAETRLPMLLLINSDGRRLEKLSSRPEIMIKACDLRDLAAFKAALDEACQALDAVPARLVHTAAIRSYDARTLAEGEPLIWSEVFNANVSMAYNVLKACLPGMLSGKFGRIVMFASNVVQSGLHSGSAYAAAKAAIVNLVRSVALEAAPDNVLINAISPAPVETDLESDYEGEYLAFRQRYFAAYRAASPTGKLVSMQELKRVAELLLSEELDNLTGQNLVIDGGASTLLPASPETGN